MPLYGGFLNLAPWRYDQAGYKTDLVSSLCLPDQANRKGLVV